MTGAASCRRPAPIRITIEADAELAEALGRGLGLALAPYVEELRAAVRGLRRDGHLYRGDLTVFGIYLELHAQVAEDAGGKHFKVQAFFDRLPAHLRVPILDDDPAAEG